MDSLDLYDYDLPAGSIAQEPMRPRENAKMMIVPQDKRDHLFRHKHIRNLPEFLRPRDVLVINNTKVFNARLKGTITKPDGTARTVELFLIRPTSTMWLAVSKPGKWIVPGVTITIAHNFSCSIVEKRNDGSVVADFSRSSEDVRRLANVYGSVPTPPYIKKIASTDDYQTAYAKVVGSVAAPTAGFHLTTSLLNQIKLMGVTVVEITLHVGLGTFQPIRTEKLEEHVMHSEWVEISKKAAETINKAKAEGRRIIAVGTTTVRALEGVAALQNEYRISNIEYRKNTTDSLFNIHYSSFDIITAYSGDVDLFITPGFEFKVIDGLLTNFHLPKSTLLVLVSALVGREKILGAYEEAIRQQYRFYSFGDAMLIV